MGVLGGVLPEHRTAVTKQYGIIIQFTERWQELLAYYNDAPSRNNLGISNENGSVENKVVIHLSKL